VLAQADLADPVGVRDRAILETFYSTGIRRGELVRLKLYDIGFEKGTLMIREGRARRIASSRSGSGRSSGWRSTSSTSGRTSSSRPTKASSS